jgi:hypothetical protein
MPAASGRPLREAGLKRGISIGALLLAVVFAQGCATKHYGRQDELMPDDKEKLTCSDIDLQAAEARAFIARVNKESEFSGLDVVAILIDFGIGNQIERSAALESLEDLRQLGAAKKCAASTV